jgi:hypothetical protein
MAKHEPSFIERLAETLHLIPDLHGAEGAGGDAAVLADFDILAGRKV